MVGAAWRVHRYDLERRELAWPDLLERPAGTLGDAIERVGGRHGQRFLLGPDGFPDLRLNAFFSSPRMRSLAATTNRDYAHSLAMYLNFLNNRGHQWWTASIDEAEEFAFWRLTDPANASTVGTSTFAKDLAACKKFYRWAHSRYSDVTDIFAEVGFPRAKRDANVKWLDPAAIRRWRDVGLRGRTIDGRRDKSWRGRNEQRDAAFVDGLYGTGLRLTEWGSVTIDELPGATAARPFYTCQLADRCAKGGRGHPYWLPRNELRSIRVYVEGARSRAVREAQAAGRYEAVSGRQIVRDAKRPGHVLLADQDGTFVSRSWNLISPAVRLKLYKKTVNGLEPTMLWLNEDGHPRDPHGWHHTVEGANRRVAAAGLENFRCTPHMFRHSFALKWFSIGKLVHSSQLSHLSDDEMKDFQAQFGDTWHFVQTMLGHATVETTKNVYLEPFRNLDVEILLVQTEGIPIREFMSQAFARHPKVVGDPNRDTD